MRHNAGFTLLEMTISVAILTIVSLLTFVTLRASTESSVNNAIKEEIGANLRDTAIAITAEVRQAYSGRTVDADPPHSPEDAFSLTVINSGKGIRFCVPEVVDGSVRPGASAPITIEFENEDTVGGKNGLLDPSEDANGDGVLTRRLVRKVGTDVEVIGAANNISDVTFTLQENVSDLSQTNNVLRIQLTGSKKLQSGSDYFMVTDQIESTIALEN